MIKTFNASFIKTDKLTLNKSQTENLSRQVSRDFLGEGGELVDGTKISGLEYLKDILYDLWDEILPPTTNNIFFLKFFLFLIQIMHVK
tara:strand:+ start:67 stop:330 length:264 start_codon:yes stop_codon:yes gene_type:complete